jgi:hypothetical protein
MRTALLRVVPAIAIMGAVGALIAGQTAAASSSPGALGQAGVAHSSPTSGRLAGQLRQQAFQPAFSAAIARPTIPFYKDSFKVGTKTYSYMSVGTDPKTSAATTHVPVTFIPVRINEPDGGFNYPTGAIKKTTGSVLFTNSATTGNTQYGAATLRSSFGKYVKAHGSKWHVLLNKPTTNPLRTLNVPSGQGVTASTGTGVVVTLVNDNWLANTLASISATVSAKSLVIFLTYDTVGCADVTNLNTCGTGGFHADIARATGTHTFAWASWMLSSVFGAAGADTAAMSHEVAEWLNDPFGNDIVPKWSVKGEPQYGCSDFFEVGDPLVGHVFVIKGLHYQDEADFSWFARQKPSIAANKLYSYRGTFKTFSSGCP